MLSLVCSVCLSQFGRAVFLSLDMSLVRFHSLYGHTVPLLLFLLFSFPFILYFSLLLYFCVNPVLVSF